MNKHEKSGFVTSTQIQFNLVVLFNLRMLSKLSMFKADFKLKRVRKAFGIVKPSEMSFELKDAVKVVHFYYRSGLYM